MTVAAQTRLINMRGERGSARVDKAEAEGRFVVIGRPSKWGNPFKIGRDGTREEVVVAYRDYIARRPDLLAALPELRGKVLGCWCKPAACHGDVLLELLAAP